MKIRTAGGEGETARGALEALAFSLKDEEVDDVGTMTITIKRAQIRELGGDETYEGYSAEVVRQYCDACGQSKSNHDDRIGAARDCNFISPSRRGA